MTKSSLSELSAASHRPCIFVLEDEMLLMMLLEDMLTDLGYHIVKASRVAKAVKLAATADIDCAILDVNLDSEPSYPVAAELRRRGIPFIFSTGYGAAMLHADYRDTPILSKPYSEKDLRRALLKALAPCDLKG